jgi:hypothetical protein
MRIARIPAAGLLISRVPALAAGVAILCLWACGKGEKLAGGSEIGNPSGIIVGLDGGRRAGVRLVLLPRDFDPVSGGAAGAAGPGAMGADTAHAVTGADGDYRFAGVPRGDYNLIALDPATGLRPGAPGRTDTLRHPAGLTAEIPDTALYGAGGEIYLQGTPFRARIDIVGRARFDSLPPGRYQPRYSPSAPGQGAPRFGELALGPGESGVARVAGAGSGYRSARVSPGMDIQAAADSLSPGDTLYFQAGVYPLATLVIACHGRPDAWIHFRNAPGEVAVLRGIDPAANLVEFDGAEFVEVEGLEVDSTNDGCDAFKFMDYSVSHHVALRGLHVHDIRGIAINSQGNHHHIAVERNHLHHIHSDPGTAVRLGDLEGQWTPADWSIRNNWIHHCGLDGGLGGGISVFRGGKRISIAGNMVHDIAAIGIRIQGLMGEASPADFSLVEGNAIWKSGLGLEALGDATLRDNVVFACPVLLDSYRYTGDSIYTAGNAPRNLSLLHNTFYGGGSISLADWDSARACVFAYNAVYGLDSGFTLLGSGTLAGNVADFAREGFQAGSAAADLRNAPGNAFSPTAASALRDRDTARGAETDFAGRARDARPDAGAYEYAGENDLPPPITEGFKP